MQRDYARILPFHSIMSRILWSLTSKRLKRKMHVDVDTIKEGKSYFLLIRDDARFPTFSSMLADFFMQQWIPSYRPRSILTLRDHFARDYFSILNAGGTEIASNHFFERQVSNVVLENESANYVPMLWTTSQLIFQEHRFSRLEISFAFVTEFRDNYFLCLTVLVDLLTHWKTHVYS